MKSKEGIIDKVVEYFTELGLGIECSTHIGWNFARSITPMIKHPIQQEPLAFFFIHNYVGTRSCELAIAVCKIDGIVEDGYSELQPYINEAQTIAYGLRIRTPTALKIHLFLTCIC